MIEVKVYGFTITAYDDQEKIYDFFIPMDKSRITNREAKEHLPVTHKLYDMKRTNKSFKVEFEELQKIAK